MDILTKSKAAQKNEPAYPISTKYDTTTKKNIPDNVIPYNHMEQTKLKDRRIDKEPTKFNRLIKYISNKVIYILKIIKDALSYIYKKINLFFNIIFGNSYISYLNNHKYNQISNPLPSQATSKIPIKVPSQLPSKASSQLPIKVPSESPIKAPHENSQAHLNSAANLHKDISLNDNIELKSQGISVSKLANSHANICWFNALLKLFYRMFHSNINDKINHYKKSTNDIFDKSIIQKRDVFLNSMMKLFNDLRKNKDIKQNTYDFLNHIYIYAIALEAENITRKASNKPTIAGSITIIKLLENAAEDNNGVLWINPALIRQEISVEFLTALIDMLNLVDETNRIITAVQVSICFKNNIFNKKDDTKSTSTTEIKREIQTSSDAIKIYHILEANEYHQDVKRTKSVIIDEIEDNQQYNFSAEEAIKLKNKIKQTMGAESDDKIDCDVKTTNFSIANIERLSEFLIDINAADDGHAKNTEQMLELFIENYPEIKLDIADENDLNKQYEIKAQATAIIAHCGGNALGGHYVVFNMDKNGKVILHNDTQNMTLNQLYHASKCSKITSNQFNKKTEQEKFIYLLQLHNFEPSVVLYRVTDKQLKSKLQEQKVQASPTTDKIPKLRQYA